MSFLRPEAVASLRRIAEPALYAAIAGACFWKGLALADRGQWLGLALLLPGGLAALAALGAVERALVARRAGRAGPGVVSVQEGRISYFGPDGGATVAIDALVGVDIVPGADDGGTRTVRDGGVDIVPGWAAQAGSGPGARWELTDDEGQRLSIPASAADADRLLDVLGGLPGFNNMAVVLAMQAGDGERRPVWRRRGPQRGAGG